MPPEVTRAMADQQAAPAGSHGAHAAPGAHDPHGHDEMGLGPIDWTAWIVGLAGVAAGALTALCFALSAGYVG